jgi:hypothetical protein
VLFFDIEVSISGSWAKQVLVDLRSQTCIVLISCKIGLESVPPASLRILCDRPRLWLAIADWLVVWLVVRKIRDPVRRHVLNACACTGRDVMTQSHHPQPTRLYCVLR